MSELTDELLDALDDLEETTNHLDEKVDALETANKSQKTPDALNAASAMLQATQLTHEATLQSQEAAEINLKLSKEQQMLMESFEENNLNLRHTLGKAREEFNSSKGFLIGILVIVLLTGIIISGLIIWLTYQTNKQQNALKDEILDIIHTQAHLNQKALETAIQQALVPSDDNQTTAFFVDLSKEVAINPEENSEALETTTANNESNEQEELKENTEQASATEKPTQTPTQTDESKEVAQTSEANKATTQEKEVAEPSSLTLELEELKKSQAAALAQLQEHITQLANKPVPVAKNNQADIRRINQQLASMSQMIKNQNQQLNKLLAKLNQINKAQAKTPLPAEPAKTEIQKPVEDETATKLNQISKELELLKAQQLQTQETLNKLTQEVAKPAKTSIDKDAYSYRNPYEYKDIPAETSKSNKD